MASKWGWAAAAGLVILAAAGAYFFFGGSTYQAEKARTGPAVEAVYATGTVEPVRMSRAGPKIAGRIVAMPVRESQMVTKGDLLVVLDDTEARSRVAELEARLDLAKAEQARVARLFRSGNISASARDQAFTNTQSAQAALNAAEAQLSEHHIRAPMSGQILRFEDDPQVGDLVRAGETLAILGDPAQLWIEADVDEEDIPHVKIGQRALIRSDAFPDRALEGEVRKITPFGDPVRRSYRVHIALPSDTPLLSGMTTEINIIVRETEEAVLVPTSALAGNALFVLEDGKAVKRNVAPGTIGRTEAEIRSGLEAGEIVLLDPAGLEDGMRVDAALPAE